MPVKHTVQLVTITITITRSSLPVRSSLTWACWWRRWSFEGPPPSPCYWSTVSSCCTWGTLCGMRWWLSSVICQFTVRNKAPGSSAIFILLIITCAWLHLLVPLTGGCPDHHGHCARWFWLHAGVWRPGLGSLHLRPAGSLPGCAPTDPELARSRSYNSTEW